MVMRISQQIPQHLIQMTAIEYRPHLGLDRQVDRMGIQFLVGAEVLNESLEIGARVDRFRMATPLFW